MVNKPLNARGARSLNIFPCFAVDFLEVKQETETMVNSYYWNADQYRRNWILNSPIVVYTSENAVSAERKVATVGEFEFPYHSMF